MLDFKDSLDHRLRNNVSVATGMQVLMVLGKRKNLDLQF